jgi:Uma2 family endonuclease
MVIGASMGYPLVMEWSRIMNATTERLLTADEYLRRTDWAEYELIDGVLIPRHGGAMCGQVSASLGMFLGLWCRPRRFAHVFGFKCPYRCFPGRPDTVRHPSISLVRYGRLPGEEVPKHEITIPPDLVAEVTTPWDTYENVEERVGDYRSAGVKLIWIVSPEAKTVLIRRLDRTCAELDETGTLSGEDVIPGFTCPVAELFE